MEKYKMKSKAICGQRFTDGFLCTRAHKEISC